MQNFGYTVSQGVAMAYQHRTGKPFTVVRNMPLRLEGRIQEPSEGKAKRGITSSKPLGTEHWNLPYLLYVGAVNQNRGLEQVLYSMLHHPWPLVTCGDGPGQATIRQLITTLQLSDRVVLAGLVPPDALGPYYQHACLGLLVLQGQGLNYRYSLANKFFDYVQHHLPSVVTNYPEYVSLIADYKVARLVSAQENSQDIELYAKQLASVFSELLNDYDSYLQMQQACLKASKIWCWERERDRLTDVYKFS